MIVHLLSCLIFHKRFFLYFLAFLPKCLRKSRNITECTKTLSFTVSKLVLSYILYYCEIVKCIPSPCKNEKFSQPTGFEPARGYPSRFQPLGHDCLIIAEFAIGYLLVDQTGKILVLRVAVI